MSNTTPEPLATVREAAAYLNVKPSWVYDNWRAVGLPGFKVGKGLRFRLSEVDAWLEAQRSQAAA